MSHLLALSLLALSPSMVLLPTTVSTSHSPVTAQLNGTLYGFFDYWVVEPAIFESFWPTTGNTRHVVASGCTCTLNGRPAALSVLEFGDRLVMTVSDGCVTHVAAFRDPGVGGAP